MEDRPELDPLEHSALHSRLVRLAGRLVRGTEARDEVVQRVWLRFVRGGSTVPIRSRVAFLQAALMQEAAAFMGRERRRVRQERELAAGLADVPASPGCRASPEDLEVQIERLRGLLSPIHRRWLADLFGDLDDGALAARDGVKVAAIRKRKSFLFQLIRRPEFLERILDVSLTSVPLRHLLGNPAEAAMSQPDSPTPRLPDLRIWCPRAG
ncbi:MAG: hypothetical protein AB7I19_09105 [Planctomycetota bacterium]